MRKQIQKEMDTWNKLTPAEVKLYKQISFYEYDEKVNNLKGLAGKLDQTEIHVRRVLKSLIQKKFIKASEKYLKHSHFIITGGYLHNSKEV